MMVSYDDNFYYSPEKSRLTTVGEVEWSEPDYSFDLTTVWRHEDGRLFWADDEGCSCPSPYEDFNSLDDLYTGTPAELQAHLEARNKSEVESSYGRDCSAQIAELMGRVVQ